MATNPTKAWAPTPLEAQAKIVVVAPAPASASAPAPPSLPPPPPPPPLAWAGGMSMNETRGQTGWEAPRFGEGDALQGGTNLSLRKLCACLLHACFFYPISYLKHAKSHVMSQMMT